MMCVVKGRCRCQRSRACSNSWPCHECLSLRLDNMSLKCFLTHHGAISSLQCRNCAMGCVKANITARVEQACPVCHSQRCPRCGPANCGNISIDLGGACISSINGNASTSSGARGTSPSCAKAITSNTQPCMMSQSYLRLLLSSGPPASGSVSYEQYLKAELMCTIISGNGYIVCPNCGEGLLLAQGLRATLVKCPRCEHKSCAKCETPWHEGSTCEVRQNGQFDGKPGLQLL